MWSDVYAQSNLVQALLAGALAAVLFARHRTLRTPHLQLWAIGWTGSALSLLAGAISVRVLLPPAAGAAVLLSSIVGAGEAVQAGALLAGALAYPVQRAPPALVFRALFLCALGGGLLASGAPGSSLGDLRAVGLPAFTCVAFLWSARLLWKARGAKRGPADAVALPALGAYGLLQLGYPLLLFASRIPRAARWEPAALRDLAMADSLLQPAVDVAILVWLLIEEHVLFEDVSVELRRVARIDPLTRLPNRAAFLVALEAALPRAVRESRELAVCSISLDQLKRLNSSLGPAVGDDLLIQSAARLRAAVPLRAGIARLGGDEFAVLLPDPGPAESLGALCESLLAAVRPPIRLGESDVHLTSSIGIALFPAHARTSEEMLSNAALANSLAATEGGDRVQFYAAALGAEARSQVALILALRRALSQQEFVLHFQPIVSLAADRVIAFEALVRWQRPGLPLLAPADFLPLCQAAGMADDLDDFVLRAACLQAKELRGADPQLRMAVNLSARFFYQPEPVERVRRALEAAGLPPSALELEIIETSTMRDAEATLTVLGELKQLGVGLAIDDFGTGYSSLSYLRRFPVDALKIDRSFIRSLAEEKDAPALVEAILGLARSLRLSVVVEGVETAEQVRILRTMGCDLLQGFLIGRPVPADAARQLLGRSVSLDAPGPAQ